jgi:PAS domain S-box-containing protein
LIAIADRVGAGVVVTDEERRIQGANGGFEELFGFALDEVRGRRLEELFGGSGSDSVGLGRLVARLARGEPFDEELVLCARSGQQRCMRVQGQPMEGAPHSGGIGFMTVLTDVTDTRVARWREQVTRRVGDRLLACTSLEAAAGTVGEALCTSPDVRAASVWVVEPGRTSLRFVQGAVSDPSAEPWRAVTARASFRRGTDWIVGVGAPGVAWGTAATYVQADFWREDQNGQRSRRIEAARACGIRTVCAAPVHGPHGVIAVVEIAGSHRHPGHERLPELLQDVALQFGAFLRHHQSERDFVALFRQSPDALLQVDSQRNVTRTNARAEALFGNVVGRALDELVDDVRTLLAPGGGDPPRVHEQSARRADGRSFGAEIAVSATTASGESGTIIAVRDLTERRRAADELRRSLDEKVTLVQELHHRVKNNLQVLSSLVSLQAEEVSDAAVRGSLLDVAHRIRSMALVHQQLYASNDFARISFNVYARGLCMALRSSLAPEAMLAFDAEPVELRVERAVPAGLILNELVTNAFKHGRSPDGVCRVRVSIERTPGGLAFTVRDLGPGISAERRPGSMGQTLITALVRQLRARSSLLEGPGTGVRVELEA